MKKIKILTIILMIILITMISFFGVYTQTQNRMENKLANYSYAMNLNGARTIVLKAKNENKTIIKDAEGNEVSDAQDLTDEEIQEKGYTKEEVTNEEASVSEKENYEKTKKIIEKRLNKLNEQYKRISAKENNFEYNVKLDSNTGDIIIEIPEDENTDSIVSNLNTIGKFEIVDSETNEVLMTNADIQTSKVLYGSNSNNSTTNGTAVYLSIEFNKEGSKKLEEITSKYVKQEEKVEENPEGQEETENSENESEDETEENTEENTTTEKKITMKIDGEEIMSTSFEEPLKNGKIQLSVGQASTSKNTIEGYAKQAANMAVVLDVGDLPIEYTVEENEYILSEITNQSLKIIEYVMIAIAIVALIIIIVRYKLNGLLGAVSFVGLASILLLVIRYTNVILSIEGIVAIGVVLALNYILLNKILSSLKNKNNSTWEIIKESYKNYYLRLIPIIIASILFIFIDWMPIKSFGMVMFWGNIIIAIYNGIFTNSLLSIKNEDGK